jgi:hypothetical protein
MPENDEEISRVELGEKDTWALSDDADGCIFVQLDEALLRIPPAVR